MAGGEPLLRPDWQELLDFAASLGIIDNLWTGGLPLADTAIARDTVLTTENGLIAFHISTIDPGTYLRLHSRAPTDHLELLLKGVDNLLNAGKPP